MVKNIQTLRRKQSLVPVFSPIKFFLQAQDKGSLTFCESFRTVKFISSPHRFRYSIALPAAPTVLSPRGTAVSHHAKWRRRGSRHELHQPSFSFSTISVLRNKVILSARKKLSRNSASLENDVRKCVLCNDPI